MATNSPDYRQVWLARPAVMAVYLTSSLIGFLSIGFYIWCGNPLVQCCGNLPPERLATLKMLAYVFCFGGIGGTSYSIYGLYKHVAAADYDPAYLYWYLFRGPLGGVLGLIAYLMMQGGVLVFADQKELSGTPPSTFKTKAATASLAFLAGYATNQFSDKLKSLAQAFFGEESHKAARSSEGKSTTKAE